MQSKSLRSPSRCTRTTLTASLAQPRLPGRACLPGVLRRTPTLPAASAPAAYFFLLRAAASAARGHLGAPSFGNDSKDHTGPPVSGLAEPGPCLGITLRKLLSVLSTPAPLLFLAAGVSGGASMFCGALAMSRPQIHKARSWTLRQSLARCAAPHPTDRAGRAWHDVLRHTLLRHPDCFSERVHLSRGLSAVAWSMTVWNASPGSWNGLEAAAGKPGT